MHPPGELLSLESNPPAARRAGLANRKPAPRNPANRMPSEIVEKVLHLRRTYHLGPIRIVWYLARYHDIKISDAGVYRIQVDVASSLRPFQVDVKSCRNGKAIKRYQYTAIDDATRVRALKICDRHTQANAIAFIDYVIARFPFRIREVRTDNGHKFQAKFHWQTRAFAMSTSSQAHLSSMARSSFHTGPTSRNITSC